uniref:Uncharacterized protein n=1 Tax=Lynx canadensis TaxID=61383 RepID=A0A667FS54_LYNCA
MTSTDYSTYSQAAAQQGQYLCYPAHSRISTDHTGIYGQQNCGTYGQPTDVSSTQPQTTATYGQIICATSCGQPTVGYTTPRFDLGSISGGGLPSTILFHPWVLTVAGVAPVACGEEEVSAWTTVVLVECSEVALVKTEVASVVVGAWTEVALVEEN